MLVGFDPLGDVKVGWVCSRENKQFSKTIHQNAIKNLKLGHMAGNKVLKQ